MAEASAPQPVPIRLKFPSGADNRDREYELPDGTARVIDNMDVTRGGGLRCRPGARLVASGAFHSLFWNAVAGYGLVVKDGVLSRVTTSLTLTPLTAVAGLRVAYAELNGAVYWTDGFTTGCVDANGALGTWGLNPPPPLVASASASGGLTAGDYQITQTAVVAGVESGAPECVTVTVAEGGGITVTTPASATATFRVYLAGPYGESNGLREVGEFPAGASVIIGTGWRGKRLESLHAIKPMPGQCLAHHKGRLWIAAGAVGWFTSELSPHWLFPAHGYYLFDAPITMLGAVEDGLYVATATATYFLQGKTPTDMTQRLVGTVGALEGSGFAGLAADLFVGDGGFPGQSAAWIDSEGYVTVGKAGGVTLRPHKTRYGMGRGSRGAVTQVDREGLIQLVALSDLHGGTASGNRATDTPVANVDAQGITLGAWHLTATSASSVALASVSTGEP